MSSPIELLQKLIAHERSCRSIGNTAEAEAFASRIQKILTDHKLSMSQVEYEAEELVNPIGETRFPLKTAQAEQWRVLLAQGVGACCYCRVFWHDAGKGEKGRKAFIFFFGRKSDRELADEMFSYLGALGESIALSHCTQVKKTFATSEDRSDLLSQGVSEKNLNRTLSQTLRKWRNDFMFGYAAALHKRLTENRESLEAAAGESSCGLILRDRQAIDDFLSARYEVSQPEYRKHKTEFSSAIATGYATGQNVSLRQSKALPSC